MLKKFLVILWNRAQIQLIDVLLDILIGAFQEFRRAQRSNELDVNQDIFKNPNDNFNSKFEN